MVEAEPKYYGYMAESGPYVFTKVLPFDTLNGLGALFDFCPTEAEDADGWDDEDGCADADNRQIEIEADRRHAGLLLERSNHQWVAARMIKRETVFM